MRVIVRACEGGEWKWEWEHVYVYTSKFSILTDDNCNRVIILSLLLLNARRIIIVVGAAFVRLNYSKALDRSYAGVNQILIIIIMWRRWFIVKCSSYAI